MGKCLTVPFVRNSEGKMVASKLFNSLWRYLPSRSSAKENYHVSEDESIKAHPEAKYDENGELTFNSLRTITKMDISEEKLKEKLNKEIGAGTMSYQQAIAKVRDFNENSEFRDSFMVTATYNNKGQYDVRVVNRTPSNVVDLEKTIENQELKDRIINRLRDLGVSVSFIEGDNTGRYSTINATKTAEGLYSLIEVSHGGNVSGTLAEEAGHFIIGAMGKSPLVDRLLNLLNDDVQKAILGEDYETKNLGGNPRREVAGVLVGKALEKALRGSTPWEKLANRIASLAKIIFAKLSGNDVLKAKEEAKILARKMAHGFMSDGFEGNVDNAIGYKEIMNSAELPANLRYYRKVIEGLGSMAKELKAVSHDRLFKKAEAILGSTIHDRDDIFKDTVPNSETLAFEGMCEALVSIADLLIPGGEIDSLLESVDFNDTTDFYSHMAQHGNSLRQVRTFLKNAHIIAQVLETAVNAVDGKLVLANGQTLDNVAFVDILNQYNQINFKEVLRNLGNTIRVLDNRLQAKETAYFCRFCEDIYGKKYINRSAQVIWKNWKLKVREAEKVPLSDLLDHLDNDIDIFHAFIGSMSNNPDIIGQIIDKAVKTANAHADRATLQYRDRLRALQQELKDKYGLSNTDFLFERDENGAVTGNFITAPDEEIEDDEGNPTAVNYAKWEKERIEEKNRIWEEFKKDNPEWESWTGFTRGMKWEEYSRKKMKEWNLNHSVLVKVKTAAGGYRSEWRPNASYKSDQYDKIIKAYPGIEKWIAEVAKIKEELDNMLPPGSAHIWRAPQFRGTFMTKVRNKKVLMSTGKAYGVSIRNTIADTFCETSEDTDYGSLNTMNNPDEQLLGTPLDYEKEKPQRLPLYGINKLKDMTQLSTDIFHSLLSYASMATSYNTLSNIVDAIEVGKEALQNRTIKGAKTERDLATKDKHTRAFRRYLKYVDCQVYGISATYAGFNIGGRRVLLNKVIQFINRLGSTLLLGGNVLGGTVNLGTGAIEIFKEAYSSQYFSLEDWRAAHKYYWGNLHKVWIQSGKLYKQDKLSLFMNYFNVKNMNREELRGKFSRHSRAHRLLDASIFLPYSAGDHYMQSMAYLSCANGIKLVSTRGTRCNLFEAYDLQEIDDKLEDSPKTLAFKGFLATSPVGSISYKNLEKEEIFLKDGSNMDKYETLKDMLGQVETALSSPFGAINFNQEQLDYLAEHRIEQSDLNKIKTQVQNDIFSLIWTQDDESAFMDKAREINIRLHGIYNNQDKTVWHQNWFTNAFLVMKGYALGMLERRIAPAHYSIVLGNDAEGSLNTMSKLWLGVLSNDVKIDFWTSFLSTFFTPFLSKEVKQKLISAGFSSSQMANMKRNFMDWMIIWFLFGLKCLSAPDDEEEDNWLKGMLYYLSSRWLAEQEAYNAPAGFALEKKNLLNFTPVGFTVLWEVGYTLLWAAPATLLSDKDSEYYYQRNKKGKYEKGDAKFVNTIRRFTYGKIYNVFHPYEAYKGWEYGRKLNR